MLPLALLLAGSASAAPIRVTCVGDSITIHACASNDTMPYPQQLGPSLLIARLSAQRRRCLMHCCHGAACSPSPSALLCWHPGRILGPGYNVSNLGNSGKNLLKKGLCGGGVSSHAIAPLLCELWAYFDRLLVITGQLLRAAARQRRLPVNT